MISIHIDPSTNDISVDISGRLRMVQNAEAVSQHVRQRLLTHEGEWFLDTTAGLPWFARLLGKAFDPALAEALVKSEIADTDGVTEIGSLSISFDPRTRGMTLRNFEVGTVFDG